MRRCCLALCLALAAPVPVLAAGMDVGAVLRCAWWDPAWRNSVSGESVPHSARKSYPLDPAFMYGPSVSVHFDERWGLSASFLFGDSFRLRGAFYDPWRGLFRKIRAPLSRYEGDIALSFSTGKYFTLLLSFPLRGRNSYARNRALGAGKYAFSAPEDTFIGYGPGLGAALTVPLPQNFLIKMEARGFFLRGWIFRKELLHEFTLAGGTYDFIFTKEGRDLNMAGCDAEASLGYFFEKASLTASLGGRYGFVKSFLAGGRVSAMGSPTLRSPAAALSVPLAEVLAGYAARRTYGGAGDHIYGLAFSLVYSLEFRSRSDEKKGD